MNPFVIELKRRKKGIIWCGLFLAAVYLFGIVLGITACTITGEMQSVPAGTIFALIAGMILQGFGTVIQFSGDFNLALSMGQTRRRFVWCSQGVSFLEFFGMTLLLWLMWQSEQLLYSLALPEVTFAISFHAFFRWEWIVPVMCILLALEILLSACLLRFSTKAMWAIWLTWMLFSVGMLRDRGFLSRAVTKWVVPLAEEISTNSFMIVGMGILLAVVLETVSWLMLRKQRVTV